MLDIKKLTIYHEKDMRNIIENLSLSLQPNDKIALIGEEGNGKSTLLKAIHYGSLPYTTISGGINGNALTAYLPQILETDILNKTLQELLKNADKSDIYKYAKTLSLDVDSMAYRKIYTLSGGEQVKLMLIHCLLQKPDILLLDEPTNSLDIDTLEAFEKIIKNASTPILFASHDETLISNTANAILYLEQIERKGVVRYTFTRQNYGEFLRSKNLAYDTQLAHHKKDRAEFEKKQTKYLKIYQKVQYQQNTISRQDPHGGFLLKKKMHTVKSMGRRLEREKENLEKRPLREEPIFLYFYPTETVERKILDFEIKELRSDRLLAKNVKMEIRSKDKIAIIGKNGCGKSTLLKQIHEQLKSNPKVKLGYMPQNYDELLNSKTPIEFLQKSGTNDEHTLNMTILGNLRFTEEEMRRSANELSGGQKAKLMLAKLVLDRSDFLILDEPTRNLSPLSNPVIQDILDKFDGGILAVTHDRLLLDKVFDEIIEWNQLGGI